MAAEIYELADKRKRAGATRGVTLMAAGDSAPNAFMK
jgi:hypothetical protein